MSETRFTPGPWCINAPGPWICTVGNNPDDPAIFGPLPPEGEPFVFGDKLADARLIAAAPEMFELLTAIDDMWSDDGDGGRADPIDARSGKVREIWTGIRAALAKARGENP